MRRGQRGSAVRDIDTTPRLTADEFDSLVTAWNKQVRRGVVPPACITHEWARMPFDTDEAPRLVCIHCMKSYAPEPVIRKRGG